jgi:hypothetical protein
MSQTVFFKGKNPKFTEKASEVLPWLVKYAAAGNTVEYGVLGKAVAVNPHTELKHVLGVIGETLHAVDPEIPKIQMIVINQQGVVGNQGLEWIIPQALIPGLSLEEKRRLCKGEQREVFEYSRWGDVLAKCGLEPLPLGAPLDTLLEQASASIPHGETEHHRILKEYVRAHPDCVGLKKRYAHRLIEYPLLSGDRMDVFFESASELVCVEVKGKNSPEPDILRGIFQCVKYRAVLEAERLYRNDRTKPAVGVYLATAGGLSEELRRLAQILNVPVVENVAVPVSFVAPRKKASVPGKL